MVHTHFWFKHCEENEGWEFAYYDTSSSTGDKNDGPPYICTVYKVNRAEKKGYQISALHLVYIYIPL